jgi:hypothetical protein
LPVHPVVVLCFEEHEAEHVLEEQPGQVYTAAWVHAEHIACRLLDGTGSCRRPRSDIEFGRVQVKYRDERLLHRTYDITAMRIHSSVNHLSHLHRLKRQEVSILIHSLRNSHYLLVYNIYYTIIEVGEEHTMDTRPSAKETLCNKLGDLERGHHD